MTVESTTPPRRGQAPPFGERELAAGEVDRVLSMTPLGQITDFELKGSSLRSIIAFDGRILSFRDKGAVVVRRGDYGNSVFFVMRGAVRVVLESTEDLIPPGVLGRREPRRRNWFLSLVDSLKQTEEPEVRKHYPWTAEAGMPGDTVALLDDVGPVLLNRDLVESLDEGHPVIGEGDFFGELAALGRTPRSATVITQTDECEIYEIRWQGVRDLMQGDREHRFREIMDQRFRGNALASFPRAIDVMTNLRGVEKDIFIEAVRENADLRSYGQYDRNEIKNLRKPATSGERRIVAEGHYPEGLVVVRSGLVRVTKKQDRGERTVGYLLPGQSYGLRELAHNWRMSDSDQSVPAQHSLHPVAYVGVVVIPTTIVERYLLPAIPEHQLPELFRRPDDSTTRLSEPVDSGILELLTQQAYINGTATMIIDMERCTRCDDCVAACAKTHEGNPRFVRHGPIHDNFMIATACMHCADPVCMIGCPTGAIHRDVWQGQVVINDDTCIGCQTCANNCPYHAIRMVVAGRPGSFWGHPKESKPFLKATKCDLCVENVGGPACERACPHVALKRVDFSDRANVAKALLRR